MDFHFQGGKRRHSSSLKPIWTICVACCQPRLVQEPLVGGNEIGSGVLPRDMRHWIKPARGLSLFSMAARHIVRFARSHFCFCVSAHLLTIGGASFPSRDKVRSHSEQAIRIISFACPVFFSSGSGWPGAPLQPSPTYLSVVLTADGEKAHPPATNMAQTKCRPPLGAGRIYRVSWGSLFLQPLIRSLAENSAEHPVSWKTCKVVIVHVCLHVYVCDCLVTTTGLAVVVASLPWRSKR